MKINLHFPPEMPLESSDCLTFHYNTQTGRIYLVINSNYSSVYGLFNMYDYISPEVFEEHKQEAMKYNDGIIAWAYMDEVAQGVFDEIHG